LDFFDDFGVKVTLFVIAEDLHDPRKTELLTEAVKRGHEIASHSLTHRKLTTLDSNEKRREIIESRERLTETLGVEVRGFRAPNFDIDRESFELISEAGYTYDSSVMPCGRLLRRIGYCEMNEKPYKLLDNNPLWELPIPVYKLISLPFHPCYGLVLGHWFFRIGLRKFRQTKAPFILLFHLTDLAEPLANERLPNWKAKLFTLSHMNAEYKRLRCEQMLELVKRNYQLVNTIDLLEQLPQKGCKYEGSFAESKDG
jgi:peptidoglycan/xylan/chitin deacetylase (PgdA/CDA1 family)